MHGDLPTYEYYVDKCCGQLSVEAFHAGLAAAARLVRWATGGRVPAEHQLDAYRRAVCAAVDCYGYEPCEAHGTTRIETVTEGPTEERESSCSIGDFKVSYHEPKALKTVQETYTQRRETGDEAALRAVVRELSGSGLSFAGAR